MDAYALRKLIRKHGVQEVGEAVANFERQFMRAIDDGWDLTDWYVETRAGMALFHRRKDGMAVESVLVVNAGESERATYEALAAQSPVPCLVMMIPQGVLGQAPEEDYPDEPPY